MDENIETTAVSTYELNALREAVSLYRAGVASWDASDVVEAAESLLGIEQS